MYTYKSKSLNLSLVFTSGGNICSEFTKCIVVIGSNYDDKYYFHLLGD